MDVKLDDWLTTNEDLLLSSTTIICIAILCTALLSCWCYLKYRNTTRKNLDKNARETLTDVDIWNTSALPNKLPPL